MTRQTDLGRYRTVFSRVRMIAACAAGIAMLAASGASADVCDDLRAQLRSAGEIGPGTSAQVRRYAEAAIRQAQEIEKTRAIQSARGCFGDPSAVCQSLNRTIQQMSANLDALERQRDRLTGRRNTVRIRAIEARLARFGCNETQRLARTQRVPHTVTVIPDPAPRAERKSRIIVREGIGRQRLYDPNEGAETPIAPETVAPTDPNEITITRMPGTFRTLCVRTCDGYYFPISFSTGFDFLQRDAEACQSLCPATEAKLFFHRVPGEESEDMISLQGRPYTEMPNAFLYRKRGAADADPACTCGTPLSTARAADAPAATDEKPLEMTAVPTPAEKPHQSEEGEAAEETTEAASAPEEPADGADGSRNVRVVGPVFLPAPEAEEYLQSPDPTNDR